MSEATGSGRRGTVRLRTTLAAALVTAISLTAGAWILLVVLQGALTRSQDDAARIRAQDVAALASAGTLPRSLTPTNDDGFVQVVAADGTVLSATTNFRGRSAELAFRPAGDSPVVRTVKGIRDDSDLEDFRVWALRVGAESDAPVVYVATSLELVSDTVGILRGLLVVGVPLMTLVLAGVTWSVTGHALGPVESIRAEVADISASDLSRRVPEPPGGDEIAQLARTMNAMLVRLEASSLRQRTFAADASHELQSPLTRLRTHLEVAMAHPDTTDWPALVAELWSDGAEMEHLVRDLLFLAVADEPAGPQRSGDLVDLDDVVLDEVARVRAGARAVVETVGVSAAPVRGSREQLARLVRNLLENALRHAATRVTVQLGADDEGNLRLAVADDGPGLPPEDRERVFDRFVRLDGARSAGGTGLGLAIVASVAAAHGGSAVASGDGPGATFVVLLPGGL